MPREIWEVEEVEQHTRSTIHQMKHGAWAEAMLVTGAELKQIVIEAIQADRT